MTPDGFAPYLETLNKHPEKTLTQIMEQRLLPEIELEALLEDILQENAATLTHWVQNGLESWKRTAYKDSQLALNALAVQTPEWFDAHSAALERIFAKNWELRSQPSSKKGTPSQSQAAINAIMALVSNAHAGLGLDFLDEIIEKGAPGEIEELRLRLLKAKIRERRGLPILDEEPNLESKPFLAPLKLYSYRKTNPARAIAYLLHLDDQIEKGLMSEASLDPVRSYFGVYLRQSIFNWLENGSEDDFLDYLNRSKSITSKWFHSVFDEVMKHPALEDINKRCEHFINKLTDKQHQKIGQDEVEKMLES